MTITTLGWIVVGVAVWVAVATVVGVLIGGMVRERDRQVPQWPRGGRGPADQPVPRIPEQTTHPDHDRYISPAGGRDGWRRP